jgi:hypothetical protein
MRWLRWAVVAATLIGLAGCESAAEVRAQDAAQCSSYGFKPGTDAFASCLQRENLARRYQLNQMQMWPGPPYWWMPPPPP